jgi:DCN1-like protein 1/2
MYGASAGGSANEQNIKTLFSNFANKNNKPFIDQDGLTCFFEAINVEMEDPVTLVIAYSMGVKESSKIEYSMFKKGCDTFNADSIEKWVKIIPDLKKDFKKNLKLHKEVYEFAYVFSCEPGLKTIDKDIAIALWPMFLSDRC